MVESQDLVFREALNELAGFNSPTIRALVLYLVVESVLKGQFEFQQTELLGDPILHEIYSGLRENQKQALAEYGYKQENEPQKIDVNEEEDGMMTREYLERK